ncbi:MAG: hypothetical protein NTY96_00820 [Bacteroidetes bacterium]|nr:hypothetical protein [Bacteroidota bacterium]
MKQPVLVGLLLIASAYCYSQSDFRKGYLVKNPGDTAWGYIDYRGNKSNARKCIFMKDKDGRGKKTAYTPEQIIAYRFIDSKYYVSRNVQNIDKEDHLFLEYLIHGMVDIYYYRDEFGEHYLARKGDGKILPLTNEDKAHYVDGVTYLQESKQYIGMLKFLFQDSPEVSKETESVGLSHKSLIKISKKYHEAVCTNEQCIIYEKKIPKVFVFLGPVAGVNVDFLNRIGSTFTDRYYYFGDCKWKAGIDPSIGLSLTLTLPSLNERMSVEYDVTINRFTSKATSTTNDGVNSMLLQNDISFTQYNWNNVLMFKYQLSIGKVRPVIIAGGFLNYVFNTSYTRHFSTFLWGQAFQNETFTNNPFSKFIYGLTIGAGCVFIVHKEQTITLDLRYSSGLGIFPNLNTNLVSLTLAVPFKL